MLEIEEDLVLFTHVISPIVYRRAVRSRRLHHIDHHSWNINFISSREWPLLSRFIVIILAGSCGVFALLLLKEGSDSVLSPELFPRLFR